MQVCSTCGRVRTFRTSAQLLTVYPCTKLLQKRGPYSFKARLHSQHHARLLCGFAQLLRRTYARIIARARCRPRGGNSPAEHLPAAPTPESTFAISAAAVGLRVAYFKGAASATGSGRQASSTQALSAPLQLQHVRPSAPFSCNK